MQLSLELDEFVVFDLETTGLSPWAGDEIIEIGAMKIFGREIDQTGFFHSLVKPKRLIPEEATRINKITNEMVADAPAFEVVLPKFLDFVGNAWLVAQNAKFDMGFLMKYFVELGVRRDLEVYDTMILSRRCFPEESSHRLDAICSRLGFAFNEADRHRSIEDVRLTALAFVEMKDRLGDGCPSREKWSV